MALCRLCTSMSQYRRFMISSSTRNGWKLMLKQSIFSSVLGNLPISWPLAFEARKFLKIEISVHRKIKYKLLSLAIFSFLSRGLWVCESQNLRIYVKRFYLSTYIKIMFVIQSKLNFYFQEVVSEFFFFIILRKIYYINYH